MHTIGPQNQLTVGVPINGSNHRVGGRGLGPEVAHNCLNLGL